MTDKKKNRTIELIEDPPRPAKGDGDIVVGLGDSNIVLKWIDNRIMSVEALEGSDGVTFYDLQMTLPPDGGGDDGALGIVLCRKCARDTATGQEVCWPVNC